MEDYLQLENFHCTINSYVNDRYEINARIVAQMKHAAYVGWQSSSILKPLLQQGLSDVEEFVIYKALNALTFMCQLGLLQKPHIYEFVSDIGERNNLVLYF